jgi:hypothetical protein
MEPRLILQQCKIYQNKAREIVFIPYANVFNFYRSLDEYVINGRKINITFPHERICEYSRLVERILSCENGGEFFQYLTGSLSDSLGLIESDLKSKLKDEVDRFRADETLYYAYKISCNYDEDYQQYFLYLEPAGAGMKSVSFQIDIDDLAQNSQN